jgi:hypothetical protein
MSAKPNAAANREGPIRPHRPRLPFAVAIAGIVSTALLVIYAIDVRRSPVAPDHDTSGPRTTSTTTAERRSSPANDSHLEREVVAAQEATTPDGTSPASAGLSHDPASLPLPTIGQKPPTDEESSLLRMLAHAMAEAGLPCSMPPDVPKASWQLLNTWIGPLLAERRELTATCQTLVHDAARSRLRMGHYETARHTPDDWPSDVYMGWRQTKDARGRVMYQIVRIPPGALPKVDYLRDRSSSIDRDMAMLARDLFDRVSN